MPLAYGIGGLIKVPQGAVTGQGVPPASFRGELGQDYFDTSTSPPTEYVYNGVTWAIAGANPATTTSYGTVLLTDNNSPIATKFYADALAIAGSPVSTTTTAGIGQLATDAEAIAGTPSTGALALFVTPSNLAPWLAATAVPASFTNLTATGTVSFTGATGAYTITSATASSVGTTGAGIDLTLASASGRVVVNGEEAAADAVRVLSAAGGLDVDVALQMNLASSQSAVDAIRIVASAGGIDIDAVGSAGEDINITNTGASVVIVATESANDAIVIQATLGGIDILASGAAAGEDIDIIATGSSVNVTSTENDAGAIYIRANGGTSERVRLHSDQGTGVDSVLLESDVGGLTLVSTGLASADAINLTATLGGVDIDGALQVNIASSQNAVDAIRIVASAGGIDIDAVGAATEDINITNTGGSIVLSATESAVDAIVIQATTGGIDILASGAAAGEDIDIVATGSSVNISATEDSAGAITIGTNGGTSEAITITAAQGTGVSSIALTSTAGGITFTAGLATADAINLVASAGGVDLDAALQVNIASSQNAVDAVRIVASAGGIDIDAVGAATEDINITNTGGSILLVATEAAADAIVLTATTALGGIDVNAGTGGMTVDSGGVLSLDSAGATNLTATGAFDITVNSTAGAVIVESGVSAVESIYLHANGGVAETIRIRSDQGTSATSVDIESDAGGISLVAGLSAASAIVINASGAASGVVIDAGTLSITFGTGLVVPITTKATADTPYTILGTDYFISCDTSGGVLTVTLPNAATLAGRTFVIRDTAGNAAVNNITIATAGGNLIGGGASAATKVLSAAYSGATVYSNGVTWNYAYTA